jgi:hypothetical protein
VEYEARRLLRREATELTDGVRSAAELAELFVDLAASIVVPGSLEETVARVVAEAGRAVPGCDRAAVVLRRRCGLELAGATDDEVGALVEAGIRGDGPIGRAAQSGVPCLVPDVGADTRWPAWSAQAAGTLGAVLAYPLVDEDALRGVLALCAAGPGAFTDTAVERGLIYAGHVRLAIATVHREVHLREAIATRQTIGAAVGVLVERHRLTAEQGFALLVRASQRQNVKVRDLADWLVETGSPAPPANHRRDAADSAPQVPRLRIEPLGDGRPGVRLVGELDLSDRDRVAATLDDLPVSDGEVHLELAELSFIDVAGTRALLAAADRLHHRYGTRVVVHHPPATLTRILRRYDPHSTHGHRVDGADHAHVDAIVTLPAAGEPRS